MVYKGISSDVALDVKHKMSKWTARMHEGDYARKKM